MVWHGWNHEGEWNGNMWTNLIKGLKRTTLIGKIIDLRKCLYWVWHPFSGFKFQENTDPLPSLYRHFLKIGTRFNFFLHIDAISKYLVAILFLNQPCVVPLFNSKFISVLYCTVLYCTVLYCMQRIVHNW